jgi:beta-galactosidase/beta-glucuronidase
VVATHDGPPNEEFDFIVDSPSLWSPNSPTLYNLTVTVGSDEITSYTGFRTVSKGEVNGIMRPLINGEFYFHFGTLDQGFWPDGLYTPPTYEAMVFDLKTLKSLGMNMLRKHVSVSTTLGVSMSRSNARVCRLKSSQPCSIAPATSWESC